MQPSSNPLISTSANSFEIDPSFVTNTTDPSDNAVISTPIDNSKYYFDHAIELKFSEDLMALMPDCFQITRLDNRENMFILNTPVNSLHNKKVLHDAQDNEPIYKMKLRFFGEEEIVHITHVKSKSIVYTLETKKHLNTRRETIQVWKGAQTKGEPCMLIEGNFVKKRFRIWNLTEQGPKPVAVVKKKKFSFSNLISGNETIFITVESDNDTALVVMLISIIAEKWNQYTSRSSSEKKANKTEFIRRTHHALQMALLRGR